MRSFRQKNPVCRLAHRQKIIFQSALSFKSDQQLNSLPTIQRNILKIPAYDNKIV